MKKSNFDSSQEGEVSLIEAVRRAFPESSGRSQRQWIRWGRIQVDGVILRQPEVRISVRAHLCLTQKESQRQAIGVPIVYADRWLLVVEKPPGLLTVPAEKSADNLLQRLRLSFKTSSIFAVHRLDQESSGLVLFARAKSVEEQLRSVFEAHDLERDYMAIVEGHLSPKQGSWRSHLRELPDYSIVPCLPEEGKEAITHYTVVRYSKYYSYLQLRLETGRKHQIRVHTSEAGYPIVGDKRYGSLKNSFKRLALHAYRLALVHPMTREKLVVHSRFSLPTFMQGIEHNTAECDSADHKSEVSPADSGDSL